MQITELLVIIAFLSLYQAWLNYKIFQLKNIKKETCACCGKILLPNDHDTYGGSKCHNKCMKQELENMEQSEHI